MLRCTLLLCVTILLMAAGAPGPVPNNSATPVYTADGRLAFPDNYREWIYLTTGIDMDYNPDMNMGDHSMFDNVFVNPEAYKAFLATGTWPDKTMLVLEGRMAASKGSINQKGHYQTTEVMARSIHIKDEARFPGKWAFFAFGDENTGKLIPANAPCYSCHEQHAAVDTTFVQFYPTLLEIAKKKGTFSRGYLKDEASRAASH
jgi:Cytochrome P460